MSASHCPCLLLLHFCLESYKQDVAYLDNLKFIAPLWFKMTFPDIVQIWPRITLHNGHLKGSLQAFFKQGITVGRIDFSHMCVHYYTIFDC